jgi:hypothetical protein
VAPVFSSPWWTADSSRIQLLCHIFIRSGGSHRYSPAMRPDTLVTMATTTTGSKKGHLLIGAVGNRRHLGVLSCVLGSFGRLLVSFRKKGFLWDTPGLPLAPPWSLGTSGPCVGPQATTVFSHSLPGPGFHLVPLILGHAQEIIHGFSAFWLRCKCSIRSYHFISDSACIAGPEYLTNFNRQRSMLSLLACPHKMP